MSGPAGSGSTFVRQNLERGSAAASKVIEQPGQGSRVPQMSRSRSRSAIIAGLTVEVGDQALRHPRRAMSRKSCRLSACVRSNSPGWGEAAWSTFPRHAHCLPDAGRCAWAGGRAGRAARRSDAGLLLRLASGDLFALVVDRIHSHGDLVVKPLGAGGDEIRAFMPGPTLLG